MVKMSHKLVLPECTYHINIIISKVLLYNVNNLIYYRI